MKKLVNDPKNVVPEMLEGLVRSNPGLELLQGQKIVLRCDTDAASNNVAVISGGGAGHEPAHAGYVGTGLLAAAVSGDVFSSPSTDAVLAAIRAVGGPAGVLLIVKNYTGDRLNFGLAAELARLEGIAVELVLVGDDVALGEGDHAGRRGVAGTILVHKIAGAAAAAGLPLGAVKAEAQAAASAVGSMGVALSGSTVPGMAVSSFQLEAEHVELGLGIHGEPGVERMALLPADGLTDRLLLRILQEMQLKSGDDVVLMVNNLGTTPTMELNIVARRALALLEEKGVNVQRMMCGTFLTSLDMAGCSLSLLRLANGMLERLDAPTSAPAWLPLTSPKPLAIRNKAQSDRAAEAAEKPAYDLAPVTKARRIIEHIVTAILNAESRLTELDRVVGDGDLGISLARGAASLLQDLSNTDLADASTALRALSASLRRTIGGTSGPLYAIGALRAAEAIGKSQVQDVAAWAKALQSAGAGIAELGGASVGDRTMLDALIPAAKALADAAAEGADLLEAIEHAVAIARSSAAATGTMLPRRGRSSYLGQRAVGHPDPGAEAVVVWLDGIRRGLSPATQTNSMSLKSETV